MFMEFEGQKVKVTVNLDNVLWVEPAAAPVEGKPGQVQPILGYTSIFMQGGLSVVVKGGYEDIKTQLHREMCFTVE